MSVNTYKNPILNQNTFDLSDYTNKAPAPRKWYCMSNKCCEYVTRTTEVFDKAQNKIIPFNYYGRKNKIFKLESFTAPSKCPDCGQPLFGEQMLKVDRKRDR